MNQNAPNLLSEFRWDGLVCQNRVAMSPMTRGRAGEAMTANSLMARYYAQRASAGIIITEGTFISEEAVGWIGAPGIWTDEQAGAWTQVVDAVHENHRTPIFLQLWHTGRASHSDFHDGAPPVAPSAIQIEGATIQTPAGEKKPFQIPRALRTEEIPRLVEDYRLAAKRAKAAGFDGIEIHGGNGYLLDEFFNQRRIIGPTNMVETPRIAFESSARSSTLVRRFSMLLESVFASRPMAPSTTWDQSTFEKRSSTSPAN